MMTKTSISRFKILIVDDEPDLLDVLVDSFMDENYIIETAKGGDEALQMHQKNAFDLIITDVRMPLGDGLALLKHVKQINKATPVICITGYSETSSESILRQGAAVVFEKPFDIQKLHITVAELLRANSSVGSE